MFIFVPSNRDQMAKKTEILQDPSTEEKIKEAARKVFTKKGFAAARTRDIAEEAGINLALLNYYFRSKEKLFDLVMRETMQEFIKGMKGVFNHEESSLLIKVQKIVDNYIDLFKIHPDIPMFVLSEMRTQPDKFIANMGIKSVLLESHFFKQIMQAGKGKVHPLHFMMNLIGLTVFPFIASPLLMRVGSLKQKEFDILMEERKKMIPLWIEAMMKVK